MTGECKYLFGCSCGQLDAIFSDKLQVVYIKILLGLNMALDIAKPNSLPQRNPAWYIFMEKPVEHFRLNIIHRSYPFL